MSDPVPTADVIPLIVPTSYKFKLKSDGPEYELPLDDTIEKIGTILDKHRDPQTNALMGFGQWHDFAAYLTEKLGTPIDMGTGRALWNEVRLANEAAKKKESERYEEMQN